ncbi:hypothetical protein [Tessaracoccus sp. MC1756]|uniref:hypothetical protein n=1 Tax=Tessaracoccus sp. MC1756 TaxID=2760311 RepID=UPI00351C2D37
MEIGQHPAVEALIAVDALLSGIDVEALASCPEVELVHVMRSARRLRSRIDALACVVTDHVNRRQASMKAVGTPTTSLIALDENLDNRQAAGQVALAGDMVRHEAPSRQPSTEPSRRSRRPPSPRELRPFRTSLPRS